MMSSTSTSRASRSSKDKSKTQPTQNVKSEGPPKNQATAEQMRLAQIGATSDDSSDMEKQLKMMAEITGRSMDECHFALHDCDNDVDRAVEMLLEKKDTNKGEWKETTKKRKKQSSKSTDGATSNHKSEDDREKSRDREVDYEDEGYSRNRNVGPRMSRGRAPPRMTKGRADNWKGKENEENERNRADSKSRDRSYERGKGRGRGSGPSRGRGRGRGGNFRGGERRGGGGVGGGGGGGSGRDRDRDRDSSSVVGSGTGTGTGFGGMGDAGGFEKGPQIDTWTNETAENAEKGTWGDTPIEDWTADEWQGSLEETKVFTASASNDNSKDVFSSLHDNDAKMFTAPPSMSVESQILNALSVSSNSTSTMNTLNDTNSLGDSLSNSLGGTSTLGQRLDLGMLLPKVSAESSSGQSTYSNTQPGPQFNPSHYNNTTQSSYLSAFNKEATESIKNAVGIGTSSSSSNNQPSNSASSQLTQGNQQSLPQRTLPQSSVVSAAGKSQRSKLPPPSKIPASAVEMPGHMNFPVDVQFGNLDYGTSEYSGGFTFGGSAGDSTLGSNSYSTTAASMSQSSRNSMFQNSTTPQKDYPQAGLNQNKMISPPEPIPFPTDRKTSPQYSQRQGQTSASVVNNKSAAGQIPPYSQSGYSSNYPNSGYNTQKQAGFSSTTTSSYTHPSSSLTSSLPTAQSGHQSQIGSSHQSGQNQYGGHQSYQSASSFQNEPNTFSSSQGQGSLYQNSQNSSSFQNQTVSSYPSQTGSAYQNQSGSAYQSSGSSAFQGQSGPNYQSQPSSYHSRDSSSVGSSYPNSVNQSGSSYQSSNSQSASSYQRDAPSSQTGFGSHQSYGSSSTLQNSSMSASKLSDSLNKMSVKDSSLESSSQVGYDNSNSSTSAASLSTTTSTTSSSLASGTTSVPSSLGNASSTASTTASVNMAASSAATTKSATTSKAPPNLPPGVPPGVVGPNYMQIGQHAIPLPPFNLQNLQQMYSYEADVQMMQRLSMPTGYYHENMPFQPQTTIATGRDQTGLPSAAYTGADGKLNRVEAQSPTVQPQTSTQQQSAQQPFMNPAAAFPPGYNYYYPGVVPQGYYANAAAHTMFPLPAATNATHGGTTANAQFQKTGAYGSHAYSTGYDDIGGQTQDFAKAYGGASAQTVSKTSGSSAASSSATDLTGANYGKTHSQSYEKTGYHGGTPPPFGIQGLGSGNQAGPMGAPTAATAYGAPYVPVITNVHQQHSQMLHAHLQDSSSGSTRSSQQNNSAQKHAGTKNYSAPYWGAN